VDSIPKKELKTEGFLITQEPKSKRDFIKFTWIIKPPRLLMLSGIRSHSSLKRRRILGAYYKYQNTIHHIKKFLPFSREGGFNSRIGIEDGRVSN